MEPFIKYPFIFALGFLTTFLVTPLVIKLSENRCLFELPDIRRVHRVPMPNLGGITVFLGFHVACIVIFLFPWLPFNGILSFAWWKYFFFISSVLLLLGIVDDIWRLSASVKLIGQICIGILSFAYDIRVDSILGFSLPWTLDLLVTVFWIVALVNAFNLIDGIDGLAIGLAAIASCGIAGSLLFRHLPGDALILIGLLGVCLAFLRYNYYPAKIFLGDSGSMFLGYTLASIALGTASKGTAIAAIGVPLLAVGIPIFDTLLAIWRRSVRSLSSEKIAGNKGEMVMQPDMDHLHHRLLKLGLPQGKVALMLYAINGSLVLIGLMSLFYRSHALGIYLIAFVAASYLVVRHLARIELWDSGCAILKGLHKPPAKTRPVLIYPFLDCFLLSLALAISVFMIFIQTKPFSLLEIKGIWFDSLPIEIGIPFLALVMTKTYSRVWSRARVSDFFILALGILAGVLVSCGLCILVCEKITHREILLQHLIFGGISIPLLTGCRAFLRTVQDLMSMWEQQSAEKEGRSSNILLYGAGYKATLFLRQKSFLNTSEGNKRIIVGFLDDDLNLRKRYVHGYQIIGSINDAKAIIDRYNIDEIVVTAELREDSKRDLLRIAQANNITISKWQTHEIVIYNGEGGRINKKQTELFQILTN